MVALLGWGVVLGPMGALLAIPLTLTVKELLPILTATEPLPPPAPRRDAAVAIPPSVADIHEATSPPYSVR